MSSALADFTVRPSSAGSVPAVTTEPKAENSTLEIERPIATLIIRVSSVPEAPTRVPATTSSTECSTKPLAATARPVKEFNSEMRTGTSAPPIGSTKTTPKNKERSPTIAISESCGATHEVIATATIPVASTALIACWPG